ncbi:MAG: NADH-quinone oxidoreductase subunit NuoK [Myxococcales bacterium]|nr:NADH-quinone oxidoreductase subunit NuoK [Myxococcales bacterium]
MTLEGTLLLALMLFCFGIYAVLARRNLIGILIGVELMLNAANINFLAFSHFIPTDPAVAKIIVLVVIGLAAAEAAIALAIILKLYRQRSSIDVDAMTLLEGTGAEEASDE